MIKSTLGKDVSVEPIIDEYLENPETLESIKQYFIRCIYGTGLNEDEARLLLDFVASIDCKGNYIDQMIKDAEKYDVDQFFIGYIIEDCLEMFKTELYKESI